MENEIKKEIINFLKTITDNWSAEDVEFIQGLFYFGKKEIKNAQIKVKVTCYDNGKMTSIIRVDSVKEFTESFKGMELIKIEIFEEDGRKMTLISRELESFLMKRNGDI